MAMATFIACLGQQLAPDGSVPLTLANRAARAAQLHKTLGASIILSGADVSKVGITEAQAMKRILSSAPYSVAPEALLLDESAQNTIENARNTLSIIREHTSGIDSGIKMYLVTSEFHCPRSEFIFRTGVGGVRLSGDGGLEGGCPNLATPVTVLHRRPKDIEHQCPTTPCRVCHTYNLRSCEIIARS
ncbi:unnamed protein product [Durusdinium trenchii]|uniref:DUF218 domain-containing protein n=1 Tax=Durusdinium trenchii TaxID=1381693 RepID=A0ABP0SZL5_9DINO